MSDEADTLPEEHDGSKPKASGIPRIGDVIADKFEVTKVLGSGGMGVVVAVNHLQLREPYAMKFLLPKAMGNPETVERFLREARAAVRIKSEHVARVADVGELPDGVPYLLMEHLEGRDLATLLRAGPVPIPDAIDYVLQACAGVAEAHALGIIHRDLKPSNLFLTQRSDGAPLVKVLDFGIAKAVDVSSAMPALTATQAVFGTPAYMSPEHIRSAKNVDFRTDIWSLGVILYELLTGELPFLAESSAGLLAAISADEPVPLRTRRPDVSADLEAIVLRCIEKDRKKRFPTIAELALALSALAGTTSVVSVERIVRLSSPAARETSVPPPTPRSSMSVREALAPTERPVSAAPSGGGDRRLLVLVGIPVLLLAVGAGLMLSRGKTPDAVVTSEPAPTPTLVSPPPSVSVAADAAPAFAPSLAPSASPSASATASASSKPVPKKPRVTASVASSASSPPPQPKPVDPTSESH